MLVLSFKEAGQEGAYIGTTIHIRVLEIRGHQVKIGFECDRRIIVSRDCFPLASHLERQRAVLTAP